MHAARVFHGSLRNHEFVYLFHIPATDFSNIIAGCLATQWATDFVVKISSFANNTYYNVWEFLAHTISETWQNNTC